MRWQIHVHLIHMYIEVWRTGWVLTTFCLLLFTSKTHLSSDLALDEVEGLVAVDVDILLVMVAVASVAAVWVLGVTVALDNACVGG
jgi:hypothetical protein